MEIEEKEIRDFLKENSNQTTDVSFAEKAPEKAFQFSSFKNKFVLGDRLRRGFFVLENKQIVGGDEINSIIRKCKLNKKGPKFSTFFSLLKMRRIGSSLARIKSLDKLETRIRSSIPSELNEAQAQQCYETILYYYHLEKRTSSTKLTKSPYYNGSSLTAEDLLNV